MMKSAVRWLWAILLPLPIYLVYAFHFLAPPPGMHPTGLIQLDGPVYVARLQEVCEGPIGLTASNPCALAPDSPRIYFLLHNMVLGWFARLTGIPPAWVFIVFHFLAAVCFARTALWLFETVCGLDRPAKWLCSILFFWGGGVLCLAGILHGYLKFGAVPAALMNAFEFDPGSGWWCLNLGRITSMPYESYYHILFLAAAAGGLKRRWGFSLLMAVLTSASHSITGFQLLLGLAAWVFVERSFVRNRSVPGWYITGVFSLLLMHAGYHLWFLNQFPEHRSVMEQSEAKQWLLDAVNFVPAYALVGLMAYWQMRTLDRAREFLSRQENRFLLVWFVVSFALANHEFAIKPMQPAHFTRGYIWTPLFLLGAQTLLSSVDALSAWRSRFLGGLALAGLSLILVFDNMLWYGALIYERTWVRQNKGDYYLSAAQRDVLDWLRGHAGAYAKSVVVAQEDTLGYMAVAYTPLKSMASHWVETPDYARRMEQVRGFFDGRIGSDWGGLDLLAVADAGDPRFPEWVQRQGGVEVFRNATYVIYHLHVTAE